MPTFRANVGTRLQTHEIVRRLRDKGYALSQTIANEPDLQRAARLRAAQDKIWEKWNEVQSDRTR